jgi:chromosome segregation ATPase
MASERSKMTEKMEWISRFQESGRKAKAYIQRLQESNKRYEEDIEGLRRRCIEVIDERDALKGDLEDARRQIEETKKVAAEATHRLIGAMAEQMRLETNKDTVAERDETVKQLEKLLEQAKRDLEGVKHSNAAMMTGLLAEKKRWEEERKTINEELVQLQQRSGTADKSEEASASGLLQPSAPDLLAPRSYEVDHVLVPPASYCTSHS